MAAGALDPLRKPDLTNTAPAEPIGPHPQWSDPQRIVSLDPFGAMVSEAFSPYFDQGYDIRPTIAVTKAHIRLPELDDAIDAGRLQVDGKILRERRDVVVTKAAHRAGLVPARDRQALRLHARRSCAARCSSTPPACSPSWSPAAIWRCSCRPSAA